MAKADEKKTDEKATKAPGPFAVLTPLDLKATLAEIGVTLNDEQTAQIDGLGEIVRNVGEYVGKTSKQAIGQAVGAHGGGTYAAIPKRSFTFRKVESVGVPRLKWS